MGWEVPGGRSKYPTKYQFDGGTREQFKLIVGEYCRMETEKDDRQYGSLLDSLARLQAGSRIEPRWAEAMKFVSSFLELGEYASIGGSAMLLDAVVSPEQRNGYLAQVEDEVRHTNQLGYLKKYFASQYYDPAGFTGARGHRHGNPLFWNNRQQACETFEAAFSPPAFSEDDIEITDVKYGNDKATAIVGGGPEGVSVTSGGEEITSKYTLVNEDGTWKIDSADLQ